MLAADLPFASEVLPLVMLSRATRIMARLRRHRLLERG